MSSHFLFSRIGLIFAFTPALTENIRSAIWTFCRTSVSVRHKDPTVPTVSQLTTGIAAGVVALIKAGALVVAAGAGFSAARKIIVFPRESIIVRVIRRKFPELDEGEGIAFEIERPDTRGRVG